MKLPKIRDFFAFVCLTLSAFITLLGGFASYINYVENKKVEDKNLPIVQAACNKTQYGGFAKIINGNNYCDNGYGTLRPIAIYCKDIPSANCAKASVVCKKRGYDAVMYTIEDLYACTTTIGDLVFLKRVD